MGAVVFYVLIQPLLYLIAILPFPVLYLFSDTVYFLMYYVIGYRKKVVYENLKNSFPEKSEEELKRIERKFFRYLCDLFLETLKTLAISRKEARRRCEFDAEAKALFKELNDKKQSCIIVLGHFGNWEWSGSAFSLSLPQQLYVLYHPLSNKQFDKLMYHMRTRFGTKLYAMQDSLREMLRNRAEVNATAFIADQSPAPETAYWTTFLNQDTPVFWGTEKISRKMNYPVVYVSIFRPKRGFYTLHAEMLVKEPKLTVEGEITELHTKKLEQDIRKQPEIWLWSHRRWKHKHKKPSSQKPHP